MVRATFSIYIITLFLSGAYKPLGVYVNYAFGVLFAVSAIYAANFKVSLLLKNVAWWAYLFFCILAIASLIWAVDPSTSVRHVRQAAVITFIMAGLVLYISSPKRWVEAVRFVVLISGIFGFIVFSAKLAEGDLSRSYLLGGPNSVGLYFAIGAVFAFYLIYKNVNRASSFIYVLLIALGLVSVQSVRSILLIFVALSFALAFAIAFVLIKAFIFMKVRRRAPRIIFISVVIFVAISGAFFLYESNEDSLLNNTITNIQEKLLDGNSRSIRVRFELAETGYRLAEECSPFGCGLEYSRTYFEQLIGNRTYTHNNYLEVWIGLGIPGLALFLSLLIYTGIRSINIAAMRHESSQFILVGGIVGLSVVGLTHNLYTEPMAIIFIIFVGAYPIYSRNNNKVNHHF